MPSSTVYFHHQMKPTLKEEAIKAECRYNIEVQLNGNCIKLCDN